MKILKVLAWVVGTPLVLFGLLLLARFVSCGPNSADVKVMKPMAEKISEYIMQNGIPKSLKNIPDLPNKLGDCNKNIVYEKEEELRSIRVDSEQKADWVIYKETCDFFHGNKHYSIKFWFIENYKDKNNTHGEIEISFDKTSVGINFKMIRNQLIHDDASSSFDNRFGFCRQLKQ